jgi:acetyltransferase
VALKIDSPDITHKSEVGGVALGLDDEESVAGAFLEVTRSLDGRELKGQARAVLVQPMVQAGQEVILGMVRDAQFGPLVMFGSGGIEVEGLNDVAFALAPLTRGEAEGLLDATWAGRRMRGYRNLPAGDSEAVIEALIRLGRLGIDVPEVMEVEVNPFRVFPKGEGAIVLDARLRVKRD